MNKNTNETPKTLKLDVETLRHLASDQLENVVGGAEQGKLISLSVGCNCSEAQSCKTAQ